jgi:rubredoxin
MTDCLFAPTAPWTCTACGYIYARQGVPIMSPQPPRRDCPAAPDAGVPRTQAKALAAAISGRRAAGLPTLPEEEIAGRLLICRGCERFTGDGCTLCPGCSGRREYLIRLATGAKCPAGKEWSVVSG